MLPPVAKGLMHFTPCFLKVHVDVTKMELVISYVTTKCRERTCSSAEEKYLSVKNDREKSIFKYVFYITNEMQLIQFSLLLSALYMFRVGFAHHQELIKLYVQPWVLSCFPAVYRWCGCV
jgi:hypothetical protein